MIHTFPYNSEEYQYVMQNFNNRKLFRFVGEGGNLFSADAAFFSFYEEIKNGKIWGVSFMYSGRLWKEIYLYSSLEYLVKGTNLKALSPDYKHLEKT